MGIFVGSVVVGILLGLAAAWLFRTHFFADPGDGEESSHGSVFETGMVVSHAGRGSSSNAPGLRWGCPGGFMHGFLFAGSGAL